MAAKHAITIPVDLLKKIEVSFTEMLQVHEELESIILAKDPSFLKKMRKARAEHKNGKTKTLAQLKAEMCIK